MKRRIWSGMVLSILLIVSLAGCGGGSNPNPGDNPNPILYHEDFETYAAANPWTPPAGSQWQIVDYLAPDIYSITDESGNKVLQITGTHNTLFYQNGFTGNNYIFSLRFKVDHFYTNFAIALAARLQDADSYYIFRLSNESVCFEKYDGLSGVGGIGSKSFSWVADRYYTMTIRVENNIITGTITDGTNTASSSFTDDGSYEGAPFSSGKIGVYIMGTANAEQVVTATIDDVTVGRID